MWQPQGLFSEHMIRMPAIVAGRDAFAELYNYPGESFAVLYGKGMTSGQKDLICRTLKKRKVTFFRKSWDREPSIEGLSGNIKGLEDCTPDVIVAVGGGAIMDGAKLCRLFYEYPYFDRTATRLDGIGFKTRFIAVPTTVGSGAEVSSAAVFVDPVWHKKDMVVCHGLQPDVVVYDEQNVRSASWRLLCASMLDGAAHMIEGYVSVIANKMMDVFAEYGLSLFRQEFSRKDDLDYRRLQYGGFFGGIVQNHCIVGAAHGVAHQISEDGFSHGEAVGLLLPSVIQINSMNNTIRTRYEQLAIRAGFECMQDLCVFLNDLLESSGIKKRSKELKEILKEKMDNHRFLDNVVSDHGGKGNPVPITREYLEELIRSL